MTLWHLNCRLRNLKSGWTVTITSSLRHSRIKWSVVRASTAKEKIASYKLYGGYERRAPSRAENVSPSPRQAVELVIRPLRLLSIILAIIYLTHSSGSASWRRRGIKALSDLIWVSGETSILLSCFSYWMSEPFISFHGVYRFLNGKSWELGSKLNGPEEAETTRTVPQLLIGGLQYIRNG